MQLFRRKKKDCRKKKKLNWKDMPKEVVLEQTGVALFDKAG
jgi:hypothetical protein